MTRERLTITLNQEILDRLDKTIDGSKIRNRSHAIEHVLRQALTPVTAGVLILAGGKGINLRPITDEIPKCLISINGKPLLDYTLEKLKQDNFKNILISIGHLGEKVKAHFKDGQAYDLKIDYVTDVKNNGTASPVLMAKEKLARKNFIVIYGDVLAEIDYLDLLEFHESHQGLATMALANSAEPSEWGVADLQGSKIVRFLEKPKEKVDSHLINAGIYVFRPEIFDHLNESMVNLEADLFPRLAEEGKLHGYPFRGKWFDVGTNEIYKKVLKEWKNIDQK